jgi:hypothetical protein
MESSVLQHVMFRGGGAMRELPGRASAQRTRKGPAGSLHFDIAASIADFPLSGVDLVAAASQYLANHLLDATEEGPLTMWMERYRPQFDTYGPRHV